MGEISSLPDSFSASWRETQAQGAHWKTRRGQKGLIHGAWPCSDGDPDGACTEREQIQADRACIHSWLHSRIGKQTSLLKGFDLELNTGVTKWRQWFSSHHTPRHTENDLLSPVEESSQFKTSNPAFLGASSFCSLIFIQYPHVFVCEEVQKRSVANGLVNITHCNFFGNPGPRNKDVSDSLKYLNNLTN